MLVLGFKLGERVIIEGGRIVVTVEMIRGDKVRLGFQAAEGIVIDRECVHEARKKEARDADRRA